MALARARTGVRIDAQEHGFAIKVTWEHLNTKRLVEVVLLSYITCLFGALFCTIMLNVSLHLVSVNAFQHITLTQIREDVLAFIVQITSPVFVLLATWMNAMPVFNAIRGIIYDSFRFINDTKTTLEERINRLIRVCSTTFAPVAAGREEEIRPAEEENRGEARQEREENLTAAQQAAIADQAKEDGDRIDPSVFCLPLTYIALYRDAAAIDDGKGAVSGFWYMHVDYWILYPLLYLVYLCIPYFSLGSLVLVERASTKQRFFSSLNYIGLHLGVLASVFGLADCFLYEENNAENSFKGSFLQVITRARVVHSFDPFKGFGYVLTHVCINAPGVVVLIHLCVYWCQAVAFIGLRRCVGYSVFSIIIDYFIFYIKDKETRWFEKILIFEGTAPLAMVVVALLRFLISWHQNYLREGRTVQGANRPESRHQWRHHWHGCVCFVFLFCIQAILLVGVNVVYPLVEGAAIGGGLTKSDKNVTEWVHVSHVSTTVSYKINNRKQKKELQPCWSDDCRLGGSGDSNGYSICSKSWDGLSVLDFATLSQLSYFGADNPFVNESLHIHFGDFDKLVNYTATASKGFEGAATLFHFEFPKRKVAVFAVRGTDPLSVEDILEDARIWMETFVLSILMTVFPVASLWPDGMTARFILSSTLFRNLFRSRTEKGQTKEEYYQQLASYIEAVREARKNDPDWRFSMTGHSLGGGLAGILGGNLGMDAVTFSAPGLHLTRKKFEAKDRNLVRHHTNIKPQRDPVPMVDTQFGLVQNTLCQARHIVGPIICHSMGHMICDLMERCGDSRGRYETCKFNEYSFLDGLAFDAVGKNMAVLHGKMKNAVQRLQLKWAKWRGGEYGSRKEL